jgi:hypothetical protein
LTIKCDEPLSNFAFNFNLRRYIVGRETYSQAGRERRVSMTLASKEAAEFAVTVSSYMVGPGP